MRVESYEVTLRVRISAPADRKISEAERAEWASDGADILKGMIESHVRPEYLLFGARAFDVVSATAIPTTLVGVES